ncbi:hypothetical protein E4T56_gene14461 [Termitomyces sp. T112]|nr:hypothetical protein E4T56_gene14461 [Termitomyces sp. T112]
MDSPPTRQIVVDDTDSRIVYSGLSWTPDNGNLDKIGTYGPTYNHTLHGTIVSSSMFFSFDGTSVSVFGTIQPPGLSIWECFVDQAKIQNGPSFTAAQNNWNLCEGDDLTAGPHTLSIHITPSADQTFWFDYLRYTPLPNVSFSDAILYVPSNEVILSSNWEPRGGIPSVDGISIAFQPRSVATFDFVGTHVAWYGWLLRFEPLKPANSTIVIDDGEPTNLLIGNTPPFDVTHPNIIFFETPQLPATQHKLVVTYLGDSDDVSSKQTPLSLNYLLVTITSTPFAPSSPPSSTTSSSQSSSSTSPSQPSSSTSQSSFTSASRAHSIPTGIIVGSVVGGLALVAVILWLYFLRSRRKRRRREQLDAREAQPFTMTQPLSFVDLTTKGSGTRSDFSSNAAPSFDPVIPHVEPSHKPPL